ncbi:MAG: tetratricopeptide repeat protein [Candidatus Vecturithrix sp.]|jgi:tetratricopeptide (TPR) repeat protein|nr:tetratricopeptide repeat protein [Candidatus Vecturithrix sp.]
MNEPQVALQYSRSHATLLVIPLLVLLSYANTLTASWHMDDYPNILNNSAVQLTNWDIDALARSVGMDQTQGNNLSRPVSNLSFSLNWYFHGANVAGFHLVNLMIHMVNAGLLYWTILLLGATPSFPDRHREAIHSIALGACLLWALNPIQTQAVTYIVQRMTSLSTLFYLAALLAYINYRLTLHSSQKIVWGIATGISFLLALGSKENGILVPLAIILVEWLFFRGNDARVVSSRLGTTLIAGIVVTAISVVMFFCLTDKDIVRILTRSYDLRPFSLTERMLTQPRVLLFYLSLLLYPIPQRLSLEHDFAVSSNLWEPWSTLPSILLVGILIAFSCLQARKRPLLAFAGSFYFINHAVESTFLPLEMVFEHRNYLPSLFLFLPIVSAWLDLKRVFESTSRNMMLTLQVLPILLIAVLGIGTFVRNMDWQSERSLWTDAQRKSPESARPVFNLAKDLERRGDYENAIALYRKSMSLRPPRLKHFDIMALTNIGTIFYKLGDFNKAIDYYREAYDILPDTVRSRYNLAVAYAKSGQFHQAEEHLVALLTNNPEDELALDLMGLVLLKQHRFSESIKYSRRLVQIAPDSRSPNLQIGVALSQMDLPAKGAWFLRRAYRSDPGNLVVMLCMLENRLIANDHTGADRVRTDILIRYAIGTIGSALNDSFNEILHPQNLIAYLEDTIWDMGTGGCRRLGR